MFQEERLRKAIDSIETKYGSLLKASEKENKPSRSPAGRHESRANRDSGKTDSEIIPGLDGSYGLEDKPPRNKKQLQDKGNSRPQRKLDRGDGGKDRGEDRGDDRKGRGGDRKSRGGDRKGRGDNRADDRRDQGGSRGADRKDRRPGEERAERKTKKEREERERVLAALEAREEVERQRAASVETATPAPAAMQTSLFIGVGVCLSFPESPYLSYSFLMGTWWLNW